MDRKICFLSPHYYKYKIGGAEVQMYYLANELAKKGWDVYYVTEDVNNMILDNNIKLVPFKLINNLKKNEKVMINILKEIDADVYYQRGRKMYTYYVGKFSRLNDKPFVFSPSMDIDCRLFKYLLRFNSSSLSNHIKKFLRIPIDFYKDLTTIRGMTASDLVLCQSNLQKMKLKSNMGISGKIFRNIHPYPKEVSINKNKPPIVLWLANLKEWKQPEIFLSLVKELKNLNCSFIIAGGLKSDRYKRELTKMEYDINNFRYIENINLEESNELISKSSVFVNTSKKQEGFPNTYIQSWMRKTPTVTLNFDPDDIIKRKNLGYHSRNFNQLLNDVKKLIENEDLRKELGANARAYSKSFSIKNNMPVFIDLINNIIDEEGDSI